MMTVRIAGLEARAIARVQELGAGIGHKRHLAFQHIDEFVRAPVPMALARPRTGRQRQEIDAELRQARGIAQLLALARATRRVERRRVERAGHRSERRDVDAFLLGHWRSPVAVERWYMPRLRSAGSRLQAPYAALSAAGTISTVRR